MTDKVYPIEQTHKSRSKTQQREAMRRETVWGKVDVQPDNAPR
jgi:hypothetical protein